MPSSSDASDIFFTIDPEDLIGFSTNLRLRGSPSATVSLSNRDDKYTPYVTNYLNELFTLTVDYDKTTYTLFVGQIKNVAIRKEGRDGTSVADFTLVPVIEGLDQRPVATEEFTTTTGTQVMTTLLTTYGSLDSAYFDVTQDDSETFSSIIVGEDSLMEAVRRISEACNVELYVKSDGTLVTDVKKDVNSAVDTSLTAQNISSFASTDSNLRLIGVVKVLGRYLSAQEDGNRQIVDQDTVKVMGHSQDWVKLRYTPKEVLTDAQMKSMVVSPTDSTITLEVLERDPKSGDILIQATKFGGFEVGEMNDIELEVYTIIPDDKELKRLPMAHTAGEGEYGARWVDVRLKQKGVGLKNKNRQKNQRKNELDDFRITLTVASEEIVEDQNYRMEGVDNPYIQDEAKAVEVGKRIIYEERMLATSFSVSGPFIPAIREVNLVVNVTDPYTDPAVTHKCLLTGLSTRWSARNSELMSMYQFALLPPELESSSS